MATTKRTRGRAEGRLIDDIELVEAILDLAGVSYHRSWWRGGWERVVTVEHEGKSTMILCNQWGVKYSHTTTGAI